MLLLPPSKLKAIAKVGNVALAQAAIVEWLHSTDPSW